MSRARVQPPPASDAESFRVERGETVDGASKRILRATLDEATRLADESARAADERVHEVRLCLKRARALVALVALEVGRAARRDGRELRAISRALGPARDRAVAREALAGLAAPVGRRPGAAAAPRSSSLARRLRRALATDDAEARLGEAAVALERARRAVGRWHVSHGRRAACAGFQDAYRRARRGHRRARESGAAAVFHAWRKAVKRLDCQAELLAARAPAAVTSGASLRRLARLLGDLHDLSVLRGVLARAGRDADARPERDGLLALVDERTRDLRGVARSLGDELFAERASEVAGRVRASWVR